MPRIKAFVGSLLCLGGLLLPVSGQAKDVVLAEPVHQVGFLPVYVAQKQGFFKDEGIDLTVSTMNGGAMITSVVSGQAFALTASVDRNAQAKAAGKSIKAVVNLNAVANIYLMARKDLMPVGSDLGAFLKGKRIAVTAFGGTPNSMLRYLLKQWKLDPGKDVTLVELNSEPTVLTAVDSKVADVGVSSEPFISQGVSRGTWGEPFYAAKTLGPYADTAISVSEESIKNDPKLVRGFVKAMMRGLAYTNEHPAEMLAFAKAEFPTTSEAELKASLDRSFTDGIFSADGYLQPKAWELGQAVAHEAGNLKQDVSYDEVADMQFVKDVQQQLKVK